MNKFVFVAVLLVSMTPAIMFASSDYSWGMSPAGGYGQGGGGKGQGIARPARPPMGSGSMMGSGMVRPTKPPMGSGSMMGHEMKSLHMAVQQLSPTDHAALMKMIKEYLVSKGIDPAKYADMRDEIREVKQESREEMKEMRKDNQEEMKMKRDEMRGKVKDIRSHGKVNVQDISITRMESTNTGSEEKKEYVGHVTLIKQ